MRIMKRVLLSTSILLWLLPAIAAAEGGGMPLDWSEYHNNGGTVSALGLAAGADKYRSEAKRFMSSHGSRAESEGKIEVPVGDLPKYVKQLDKLAVPQAGEEIFGMSKAEVAKRQSLTKKVLGDKWMIVKAGGIDFRQVKNPLFRRALQKHTSGQRLLKAEKDVLPQAIKAAQKELGVNFMVSGKRGWDFRDVYRDAVTVKSARHRFALAKANAGNRVRQVNGGNAELNSKPPGGRKSEMNSKGVVVDKPNGLITRRVEGNTQMLAQKNMTETGMRRRLTKIARVTDPKEKGPLQWIKPMLGLRADQALEPAAKIRQDRVKYVLMYNHGTAKKPDWKPDVDVSIDNVFGKVATTDAAKAILQITGQRVTKAAVDRLMKKEVNFGSIEADLNHPGTSSGMVVPGIQWSPPHKSSDLRNPMLLKDAAVRAQHEVFPRLLKFVGSSCKLLA